MRWRGVSRLPSCAPALDSLMWASQLGYLTSSFTWAGQTARGVLFWTLVEHVRGDPCSERSCLGGRGRVASEAKPFTARRISKVLPCGLYKLGLLNRPLLGRGAEPNSARGGSSCKRGSRSPSHLPRSTTRDGLRQAHVRVDARAEQCCSCSMLNG